MPTLPTIFDPNRVMVGNTVYAGEYVMSTWAKTRCAAIIDPAPGIGQFGYSVGSNSLIIDEGFHPVDSYFFRVSNWPYSYLWFDGNQNAQTGWAGPHLGYLDATSPLDSYISIGGYNVPDSSPVPYATFSYLPYDSFLDENDCINFWEGRLVNSAFTTDNDFCNSDRATNPNTFGQNIGAVGFGGYGSISDMTAF